LTGLAFIAVEALVVVEFSSIFSGAGSSKELATRMGEGGRGRSLMDIAACASVALVFRFKPALD
jgi:hypothetical protein